MSVVIGWDIGGAHLKAASGRERTGRRRQLRRRRRYGSASTASSAFDGLKRQLGDADAHAVTMTGELCDAFASRSEGVAGLAAIAADISRRRPPASMPERAGFVGPERGSARAADIASANWRASAELVALRLRDALLIDVGSTTADLIPVAAGRVAALGADDARSPRCGRTRLYRHDPQFRHGDGGARAVPRRLDSADERIFRQQRRRAPHSRRPARRRRQDVDRGRPREDVAASLRAPRAHGRPRSRRSGRRRVAGARAPGSRRRRRATSATPPCCASPVATSPPTRRSSPRAIGETDHGGGRASAGSPLRRTSPP